MLSDKERGRLRPSDKQIIGSRKLARAQSIQDYSVNGNPNRPQEFL